MLKRTIVVTSRCYANTSDLQLVLSQDGDEIARVPIEDIGLLLIENASVVLTSRLLSTLGDHGATVVLCDERYQPSVLLQPLSGNTLHAQRLRLQVDCPLPTQKRIWKGIVQAKLANQAEVLDMLGMQSAGIRRRITKVRTNDSTNQEGVAASAYWKVLMSAYKCRRDPDGPYPNNVLNYGYAILRSAVARSLVASGLHPALGIKHGNRNNAFALADDVMEPFRPFVDATIFERAVNWPLDEFTTTMKKEILEVLTVDSHWPEGRRPLLNSIQLSAASLVSALSGESPYAAFPRLCA